MPQGKIYTKDFWLLSVSSLLFFASFNLLLPELPSYLDSLGGGEYKGLIIALFTLTAAFARPFSGKLTDTVGRVPIMIFGVVVCFVIGILYPLAGTVTGFLLLRFFHGFSTGFKPTATSAYIADIIPADRRGEALGVLGMASTTGMALGPVLSSVIKNAFGMDVLFLSSSFLAALSIIILYDLKETLANPKPFEFKQLKISKNEIIESRVLESSLLLLFSLISFGAILALIPDFTESLGIENKGLFFSTFTVSSFSCRFFAGKASDSFGREPVLCVALFLLSISLVMIPFSYDLVGLLFSAAIFGLGFGISMPSFYAWTIDLANPEKRGKAIGTMYIGLELGIGLGALLSVWIYNNQIENIKMAFFVCAGITALCFVYLSFRHFVLTKLRA